MPADRRLTPARRNLGFVVVALGLLTAPVWVTQLPVGGPVYQYERAEVTTNGTAIEYATATDSISGPISDEIACSDSWEVRPCALERVVLENTTVPTGVHASNPGDTQLPIDERYRYVRIDDAVYEPTYVANRSAQREDGMYRVELSLERTEPDQALETVSRHVTSDDLSPPVIEAARSGDARAHGETDVPKTTIQLKNGTYYRVYLAGHDDASPVSRGIDFVLTYLAPLAGLWLLIRLSRRIEVSHASDDEGRDRP
ncbi:MULTISPECIES: hypothetical protein [unclassified Natrinema]|uniref:hypothetical protein n=1 Tax=unclassified Natrinema TaxID=2622230 RepID=UPI00026D4AF5|nr:MULTISPECIES: hypothetical protein [unclassified Natrinema]AFO59262.1 hypothetical protein NJ7G_4048 [Natrinema sp. J7-2]